ncbi:hypothetical protein [Allokutzneria sp. NRRL B-24872]|uniref:hypothetical protein n=1 Tax=Allokutzneria sp. NRRL B-24872 TaxID=1137961 RepID=UPI000A3C5283|nr:hypothetical protein [Allokutzneria sp. NRRL B-24872]
MNGTLPEWGVTVATLTPVLLGDAVRPVGAAARETAVFPGGTVHNSCVPANTSEVMADTQYES